MKKGKEDRNRGQYTLWERFCYRLDNRLTKGSLGLIRVLIAASILMALLIGGIIILCGFQGEDGPGAVLWNSIATVINAWMPSFEDGSVGYILLMAVTAICGVLFTSVLIGIVTSAIEERITVLKKGNTRVLETGHTVILGFIPGEYALLEELILAAAGDPACAVIASDTDREEMEEMIRGNLDIPSSFRVICRTVDIFDPADLDKCAVDTAKAVIVSPMENAAALRAVLAISALLDEKGAADVPVNAVFSTGSYHLPETFAQRHRITALHAGNTVAKMIAHSCTQTGLSQTFREVFNFEGAELYTVSVPGTEGLRFSELSERLDAAVPVGLKTEDGILLNPPAGCIVGETDRIVVFAEDGRSVRLTDPHREEPEDLPHQRSAAAAGRTDVTIIGQNETLPVILRELPENVARVYLIALGEEIRNLERLNGIAEERGFTVETIPYAAKEDADLVKIASLSGHVIILNDHAADTDEADLDTIFLLLHLRDIRERTGLDFGITAEMRRESSQNLVRDDDHTDFVISSSMFSLFLAQITENPDLAGVYREILSNDGNELYLKSAEEMNLTGRHTVRTLRRALLKEGCVLLGFQRGGTESRFNPALDEAVDLKPDDCLIVLSEE